MSKLGNLKESKLLVVKIGSALLVDPELKRIKTRWLVSLIDDISELREAGVKVVLVTSGAIACGRQFLDLTPPYRLDEKQAASAVGQIKLIESYHNLLAQQHIQSAQILLTASDCHSPERYLNARNTLRTLLKHNVVPIINENDTIATEEIRYGDNDQLAAEVARMIGADRLILLSDIDGLYTSNPREDPEAEFVPEVQALDEHIFPMASGSSSQVGTGGMVTKLLAAQIATAAGCNMLITLGTTQHPLMHYQNKQRGTWFIASKSKSVYSPEEKKKLEQTLDAVCLDAKNASKTLALATSEEKKQGLLAIADALAARSSILLAANAKDIQEAQKKNLSLAMQDRLLLTPERLSSLVQSIRAIAALPDPVQRELAKWKVPSGLDITRRSVPLGVVCVIYESRPNVTTDAAALCIKSGNAVILRGGSEAMHSNSALLETLQLALLSSSLPQKAA